MDSDGIAALLLKWFGQHARDLPWRRTRDPYAIWVSEIMLQQTQVKTVIPYWKRWMEALPNLQALAKARPQKLHKLWEGLGYYTRVRNMQRAAKIIGERHDGQFPTQYEQILELPGIGRYTAGAICSIAFNQPVPILDSNVMRVLSRLFCIEGDPRDKAANARLWQLADDLVRAAVGEDLDARPRNRIRSASAFNQALMELGALLCTPQGPRCAICPLQKGCLAVRRGRVLEFPHLKPRARITHRRFVAFVIEKNGRVLVRQRPAGVVNAHLWEFPNLEVTNGSTGPDIAAHLTLGTVPKSLQFLCVVKHSITRYRITMEVFRAIVTGAEKAGAHTRGRWTAVSTLGRLPFASAHKKVLGQLTEKLLQTRA